MMNLQTLIVTNVHLIMSCVFVSIKFRWLKSAVRWLFAQCQGTILDQWRVMWLQQRLMNQVGKPWVHDSFAQNNANKLKQYDSP